jgi:hypothetical protein
MTWSCGRESTVRRKASWPPSGERAGDEPSEVSRRKPSSVTRWSAVVPSFSSMSYRVIGTTTVVPETAGRPTRARFQSSVAVSRVMS